MKTFKIYFISASLLLAGITTVSAKQGILEKAKEKAKAKKEAKQTGSVNSKAGKAAGGDKKGGIAIKKQGAPSSGAAAAANSPANSAPAPVK